MRSFPHYFSLVFASRRLFHPASSGAPAASRPPAAAPASPRPPPSPLLPGRVIGAARAGHPPRFPPARRARLPFFPLVRAASSGTETAALGVLGMLSESTKLFRPTSFSLNLIQTHISNSSQIVFIIFLSQNELKGSHTYQFTLVKHVCLLCQKHVHSLS